MKSINYIRDALDNDPTAAVQRLPAQQNLSGTCIILSPALGPS